MGLKMSLAELRVFLDAEFPEVAGDYILDELGEHWLTLRLVAQDKHLRPGGTISGPAMFSLADVAIYLATLAMIGPKALAVTINCSIDFMRRPEAGRELRGEARLLKLGRTLSVGEVLMFSDGRPEPVARASLTYSIPPADR